MLNIGQFLYPLKEGQKISEKVDERLQTYLVSESQLFVRYSSLENFINNWSNEEGSKCEDQHLCFRNFISMLDQVLSDKINTQQNNLSAEEVRGYCRAYLNKISSSDNSDLLNHIIDALGVVKPLFTKQYAYSYFTAAKMLKKKSLSPHDKVNILKCLYFGRDYLDISSVKVIRSYIIAHPSNLSPVPEDDWMKNVGNTLIGLVFGDSLQLEIALDFYEKFFVEKSVYKMDFSITESEEPEADNFNFVLMLAYFKYLIGAFIFIIQCDYSGFFDNKGVEKWLLNAYRRYGFMILTAIYKSFSVSDMLQASSMIILDDVCTFTASGFTQTRLDDARAMASALSRDIAIENFDEVIEKICDNALKEWEKGSELGHMDMIRKFKNMPRYAEYFSKRGFERNLNNRLKSLCRKHGIERITGVDISARKK